jgi:hypothetical protein
LIGSSAPDKRWVLKNPSHLFALDALLEVYPDALVVVTHRDPATALASSCSLSAQASAGQSSVFTESVIGRDQLALWSRGAEAFEKARTTYPADTFVDVAQADLVADPLAVVARIYERLGVTLTQAARARMAALPREGRGAHTYALADFGLTESDVRAAFSPAW